MGTVMQRHPLDQLDMRQRMQRPVTRGLLTAAVAWTLAWKGVSLWQAARDGSKPWFATLLVTNTLGILDAAYLFGVRGGWRRAHDEEADILRRTGEPEQRGHSQET